MIRCNCNYDDMLCHCGAWNDPERNSVLRQPNAPEYIDPSEERTQVDPFAPTEHPSEGRAEIRRSFRWAVQAVRVLGAL